MTILQGGAPKCGNFWLYQILIQILSKSGCNTTSFIEKQPIYQIAKTWELNFPDQAKIDVLDITDLQYGYRISSIFKMPIDNIKTYASRSPLVWTHSPICKRSEELFNAFDKKIYIIRDPRDRAISASKYYCSDYMLKYFPQEETNAHLFLQKNFDQLMKEWVWHVFDHLRLSSPFHIHIVYYEGFLFDFQRQLDLLLKYLELDIGSNDKEEIEHAVSFSNLKKENFKHLKKGGSGYWMEQLTDEQIEKAFILAGPLMQYLNYPLERNRPMTYPADLPFKDFDELKREIINSQSQIFQ